MNKETLRMQMLAGIITEGQYKAMLNENASVNNDLLDLVNLLNRAKEEKDEESGEHSKLTWALDNDTDLNEKFHIWYDDSTGMTFVAGNGLLLSTDESDMEAQADEMELYDPRYGTTYEEMEIDGTPIYYVWDPNY